MDKNKNGQGHFKHLSNGKVRMRKMHGYKANGKPKILQVTGTSETNCINLMKKKEENYDYRSLDDLAKYVQKVTLLDLCVMHFKANLSEKGRLKPKSADRRESTINNQIKPYTIGRLQINTIRSADIKNHIETLIDEDKLSVSSIEKTLNVINAAYKWAINNKYLTKNPCDQVFDELKTRFKTLKNKENAHINVMVLSDYEVKKLEEYVRSIKYTAPAYRYLFALSTLLLLYTGMRVGELCSLRWRDWFADIKVLSITQTRNIPKNRDNSEPGKVYIPNENEVKNYHIRNIELNEKAVIIILEIHAVTSNKKQDDYILINKNNKPSNPSNYYSNLRKLFERAGLGYVKGGAHLLRRTCATYLYNSGCSIEDIAASLGDEPETIRRYYIAVTKQVLSEGKPLNIVKSPKPKR